mgnify:CR=1 FL=1
MNRLSSLVGRGRAFEILVGGQDFDGELAERYGYVNRAIPDEQFVDFVDAFAQRVSRFDLLALADIKRFVNAATLPADEPLGAEIDAFWKAAMRPAFPCVAQPGLQSGLQPAGPSRAQPRGLRRDHLGRPRLVPHTR